MSKKELDTLMGFSFGRPIKKDVISEIIIQAIKHTKEPKMRVIEYPKSDVEIEQEKEGFKPSKWWQAIDAEGRLLMETSVRSDFKSEYHGVMEDKGVTFRRLYERLETKWVDEHPFPETVEWFVIPSFNRYEMTEDGTVRLIETKEVQKPMFVGEGGCLGFLLKSGAVTHFLVPQHELYSEVFPTTVGAQSEMTISFKMDSDIPEVKAKSDLWWQAIDSNGTILARSLDFENFRPVGLIHDPRVRIMQFIGGAPKMPVDSTIDFTEAFWEHKKHRRDS
jgi:hypothetical protein